MSFKINEEKAKSGIDNYHNVAQHFVTRCGELSEHITDRLAFTVSSVATISVAVTSVIPEGMAVAASSGSVALGIATASASVAGVFVAMRRPVVWWIYAAQLVLSLSLVRAHGGGVLMLYPLVSCFGALIAAFGIDAVEQRVAESKVEDRVDADAELDREHKAKSRALTLKLREAKAMAKLAGQEQAQNPEMSSVNQAISPRNGAIGASVEQMTDVRSSKMTKRQEGLLEEMDGQLKRDFVKEMAIKFERNPKTINRDLQRLAEAGMASVNGTVEKL